MPGFFACRAAMLLAVLLAAPPAVAQTPIEALQQQVDALTQQGRYGQALAPATELLRLREQALGPAHDDVARSLLDVAFLDQQLGRFADGIAAADRARAIREAGGADAARLAGAINRSAELLRAQGRNTEAEPLLRRALALREKALGPESREAANSLNNLGQLYMAQGRWGEAETFFKRAIAIQEKVLGAEHLDLANTLNNLGVLYRRTPRYDEAVPLHQRAIAIREAKLGAEHPALATSLNDLGDAYRWLNRPRDAEPPLKRALAIREKVLGAEHPSVATNLHSLGLLYFSRNRQSDAEAALKRSVAIATKALGPTSFAAIYPRLSLSDVYRHGGFFDAALAESRIVVDAVAHNLEAEVARRVAGGEFEARRYRGFFLQKIRLAGQIARGAADRRGALAAEAFETAQLAQASSTGRAVAGMAARFAAGGDALAAVVRERQDLAERWQRLDEVMVGAAGRPADDRDLAAEAATRTAQQAAAQALQALDARLARDFPSYVELVDTRPVPAAELQALLAPDEAMLVYLSGRSALGGIDATWLWAVRRDRIAQYEIALTEKALTAEVTALRERLDPERNPELKPFDVARAAALHQLIVAPAADMLAGARHVFVVPDGVLQSLPLGVLASAQPSDGADYRKVAWLARQYALTTLPSVASLRALRRFAQNTRAASPFVGIGDPALEGASGGTRGARGLKLAGLFRGGVADVEAVRLLPPLPDTADELRALAKSQGAGDDVLYLRERASETTLRGLKLDQYRVLAFATHGLVAGDVKDLVEPALVLTPPRQASGEDDGLLTASEIARLKLNADWVILSACNTAAGDGTPGADGLSGLAKAFFYAGSRALLVSHWPVASEAAVRLTTGAFEALRREPQIGRAEALRRAQLALLDDTSLAPAFAHPLVWAPFVVVGEGGAGR